MPVVPTLADATKTSTSPLAPSNASAPSDAHLLMAAASMHAMDRLKPVSRRSPSNPMKKNGKT